MQQVGFGGRRVIRPVAGLGAVAVAVAASGLTGRTVLAAAPPSAVVAFGTNNIGQLGTGTATNSATPVQVRTLTGGVNGVISVVPGSLFTLALRADTSVVAWGSNDSSQLGDGTQVDSYAPISVAGVGGVGVLTGIGCPVAAPASCAPLAAGTAHSLALKPDGTIIAWGNNDYGQLGDGTTLTRPTPVQVMGPGSGVVAIAAGSTHSLALKSDGTVIAWGGNHYGQLGNGTTKTTLDNTPAPVVVSGLSGVTAISAGALHSLALLSNGTVRAWGRNTFGELGDSIMTGPTAFADSPTPVAVTVLTGVTAISAGSDHNVALAAGGAVYSWGANFRKSLGQPAAGFRSSVPAPVVGVGGTGTLNGVSSIAAGHLGLHTLSLLPNNTVVAWGFNSGGQLGNGSTTDSVNPTPVTGVTAAVAIAAGYGHSVILQPTAGSTQNAPPAPLPFPAPAPLTRPAPVPANAITPPTNVLTTLGTITSYSSPVLAADPTRARHLVAAFNDGAMTACYISVSNDGGATWRPSTLVGPGGAFPFAPSVSDPSQTTPPTNMNGCWSPSIAFGPDGNLYYEYNEINPSTFAYSNLFLLVSTDGGVTFRAPQQINPTEPPASNPTFNGGDQSAFAVPSIAVDMSNGPHRGQLYSIYTRSGPNFSGQIRSTACSAQALSTFAAGGTLACYPSVLVDPGDRTYAFLIALPAVGVDGTLSVVWQGQTATLFSDVSNPEVISVASSTDGGGSFGPASTVDQSYIVCLFCGDTQMGPQDVHISIAAGVNPGDLYVAMSAPRGEGFSRAAVSVSHTYGASWASRVEIGKVTGYFNHFQRAPQLAVSPGGRIFVAYYDIAPDKSENVYETDSSNGGATWSAPWKISDTASDQTIFAQGFPPSDQVLGIAATDSGFAAAWADSRRGNPINAKTDIAFATSIPAPPPPPGRQGYWLVASDGGIFPFGHAGGFGSTGNIRLNQPIVGMASTPDGNGYWLVAADGGVFPFGNAGGYGSTGNIRLNQPIVGMAATPSGHGYWLVAADGGIFPFGDAGGFGSTGNIRLNQPIVGMASTPDGGGYWLVASDGGMFPFGDAGGFGSTGNIRLSKPMVGMAATADGGGYWLVASDGGIFPFGDAGGYGSAGGLRLLSPVVGMAATRDGRGYWLVTAAGDVLPYGAASQQGNTAALQLNKPIVGMSAGTVG